MGSQETFRKQHGIRSWRLEGFENYLIFYRSNAETVEVLRLLHGASNLPGKFRRKDSGFRIQDSGFRIQDSGFRIQDSAIGNRQSAIGQ